MRFELDLELPDVKLLDVRNGKGDYVIELLHKKSGKSRKVEGRLFPLRVMMTGLR